MAEAKKVIEFTNTEVAAKYVAITDIDYKVSKAGLFMEAPLSTITPAMAEALVSGGTNLIAAKETTKPAPKDSSKV